jgi:hypothetical protein
MAHVAIVAWDGDNKVTKCAFFELEAEADAHVAAYGGFVVPFVGENTDYWILNPVAKTVTYNQARKDADDATVYREQRAGAYAAIGDQLDAIWKQMAADKAAGKSLDAATDDALTAVLKVKSDFAKPG